MRLLVALAMYVTVNLAIILYLVFCNYLASLF
jgi:hypothetical protein